MIEFTKTVRFAKWSVCLLLTASGCEQRTSTQVEETRSAVRGGFDTGGARPEINLYRIDDFKGSCTGTAIGANYVLTAAHCPHGYSAPNWANGVSPTFAGVPVTKIWIFGTDLISPSPPFVSAALNHDVALLKLAGPAPGTPATIATRYPNIGEPVSLVGFGSSAPDCSTPAGTKNFLDFTYSETIGRGCPGDSGGPLLLGPFWPGGQIVGVVSKGGGPTTPPEYGNPVMFREDIAAVMRTWDGGFELGIDRPGRDLPQMPKPATDAAVCSSLCEGYSDCESFTWSGGWCWLKNAIPAWYYNPWCTSGVRTTRASSGANTWEFEVDRSGSAYSGYPDTHGGCRAQCLRDAKCKAYTFDSSAGFCWLKSSVPPPTTSAGAYSGVKKIPTLDQLRNGALIAGPISLNAPIIEDCVAQCMLNPNCRSYTYRRPEIGVPAQCWLYSDIATPQPGWGYATGTLAASNLVRNTNFGYY